MSVIRGTKDHKKRKQITVLKTGHPAAMRKVRCPSCKLGFAVASNVKPGVYQCMRCASEFAMTQAI
jgi:DNA-directed RNA polymerase subunit RPC12/RpoP